MGGNEIELLGRLGFAGWSLLALGLLALSLSAYVKIATVLGIVRFGFSWNSLPSVFITGVLALSLSFFVMYPTLIESAHEMDVAAKGSTDLDRARALDAGLAVWKRFVLNHTGELDKVRFADLADRLNPKTANSAGAGVGAGTKESWQVLAPAFVVAQLRDGFSVGLRLLIPLLAIDLLVLCGLLALGADQSYSAVIAVPLKILLFVAVDGWTLISENLLRSFVTGG